MALVLPPNLTTERDYLRRMVLIENYLGHWHKAAADTLVQSGASKEEVIAALQIVTSRFLEGMCCEQHSDEVVEYADRMYAELYEPRTSPEQVQ